MDKEIKLRNGMILPAIGMGTFPFKEELHTAIPIAVNTGFRLIDTSDNYNNEEYVGDVYAKFADTNSDVLIVTKFSQPYMTPFFGRAFESSRNKLYKSDKHPVDIYLLHWPYPFLWKKQWKKMENLYKSGKCKAIGVCNFEIDDLKKLLKICTVPPMINQFECHPMFQQKELTDFCRDNNIQVMSYSPFARMDKKLVNNRYLKLLADKYEKSVQQIILRWNIQKGFIPIPASVSKKHIISNYDIFDFELTGDEIEEIDGLECGFRVRFDPKKRFSTIQKIKCFIYSLCSW